MTAIRGIISRDLNIVLICITSVIVLLRFYVRACMTKSLGLDDAFTAVAVCCLFATAALEILLVSYGVGTRSADLPPEKIRKFFEIFATMELLFLATMCFVRLSIIAFLPRLSRERKVKLLALGLGLFVIAVTTICFLILLFECKHVPDFWDATSRTRQCLPQEHERYVFFTHGASGLLVDILLLVIPIWIIYSRMLFTQTAKRVILVFSVGIFVLITGAVRLGVIASLNFSDDTTFNFIHTSVWTDLEIHVGVWVACFPTLQPLIRIALRKFGLSTITKNSVTTATALPNISRNRLGKSRGVSMRIDAKDYAGGKFTGISLDSNGSLREDSLWHSDSDSETQVGSPGWFPSSDTTISVNAMESKLIVPGNSVTTFESDLDCPSSGYKSGSGEIDVERYAHVPAQYLTSPKPAGEKARRMSKSTGDVAESVIVKTMSFAVTRE